MRKINIAIDGFSACGKSTLAKDLAASLGYIYIDSGAMYRAVTLYFIENDVKIDSPSSIELALDHINIDFILTEEGKRTILNGKDVEDLIRQMNVSDRVSDVSAIPKVRRKMVEQQMRIASSKGVVMDGRDIGTVVIPDAELKLFLIATDEIRTQRRVDELQAKGSNIEFETIRQNLLSRDFIDSNREDSPLKKAEDAHLLDNSCLDRRQQHELVLNMIRKIVAE